MARMLGLTQTREFLGLRVNFALLLPPGAERLRADYGEKFCRLKARHHLEKRPSLHQVPSENGG
jgi:hypothetical protein